MLDSTRLQAAAFRAWQWPAVSQASLLSEPAALRALLARAPAVSLRLKAQASPVAKTQPASRAQVQDLRAPLARPVLSAPTQRA
jgi:hypothetical protein